MRRLFDDLLSGLAIERPIDPHGWALQWPRGGSESDERRDGAKAKGNPNRNQDRHRWLPLRAAFWFVYLLLI